MMFFTGAILLGIISLGRLPQEFYPSINFPQLTVKTVYKDAAPEEIEILITKPIEEVVGTVAGLKRISSTSKEEVSLVMAEFNWGTNMDFAALHLREKIDLIKERLPRGAEDPIVLKFNPFERPVMVLNVTGERTPFQLLEITKQIIKNELEKTEGVAACSLRGGIEREILVEVDQGRLQASGIPITKVSDGIAKSNLNFPAGTIEEDFYEYLVRTMGEFQVIPEIKEVVVGVDERGSLIDEYKKSDQEEQMDKEKRDRSGRKRLIYLKDIAVVRDTFKEPTSYSRFNGKETISLSIQKQSGAYPVQVASNVRRVLKRIQKDLPKDIYVNIAFDQSILISGAIAGVRDAAWQGGLLAILVLFFFLRSLRSSLIVASTILLAIVITFSLMYFGKVTINMISLGGLALGVGMLVDSGVVVIENIFRHRQLGEDSKKASVGGTSEVVGAVNASTLTTVAVFLPMIFIVGVIGQIFKELAFTITFSLLAAQIVAFSLIPLLSSRDKSKPAVDVNGLATGPASPPLAESAIGVTGGASGDFMAKIEETMANLTQGMLKKFLKNKGIGMLLVGILLALSLFILATVNQEFLPKVDQGQFSVKVNMPPGTKLEVTDRVTRRIEQKLLKTPEVKYLTVNVGSSKEATSESVETLGANQSETLVILKPRPKIDLSFGLAKKKDIRTISSQEFVQRIKSVVKPAELEGGDVEYVLQESEFQSAFQSSAPIVLEVKGPELFVLEKTAKQLGQVISTVPGVYGVRDSIIPPSPEVKVTVIKDRASTYNLSVSDIALTSQTALKGYTATKFKQHGREIDVKVRLRQQDRGDLSKVRQLLVHSPLGLDLPLQEVAFLGTGKGPTEIKRLSQQRTVLVYANLFKRGLSEVVKDINAKLKATKIPYGYSVRVTGEFEQMQESFTSLVFVLVLSILAVYMIMAAQFESLWQPFVIMFTVPLSLIGVALALFVTHTSLGAMVILGIIILGGVVVNNGIVLIDFVNQMRAQGMEAEAALIEASKVRLRPILMTAMTTVLGLIPLALGLGEGTEIQSPMAITVMGGLTVSTFLTLVVIPTVYLAGDKFLAAVKKKLTFIK